MPSPTEVDNFQRLLVTLSEKVAQSVTDLWNQLDGLDSEIRWMALQASYPEVVDPFLAASGSVTAEWYSSLDPNSPFAVEVASQVSRGALAANVQWALTQDDVLSSLVGSAERQMFNMSRETIVSNVEREGVMYARHASANACAFCRMLATRGAVYASEAAGQTVVGRGKDLSMMERRQRAAGNPLPWRPRFNNAAPAVDANAVLLGGNKRRGARGRFLAGGSGQTRGGRRLGDPYHDNCHCIAVPVRAGGYYEPPEYVSDWKQDYIDAQNEKTTKGEFGAIDANKVLNNMRRESYPQRKDALNARRRELYAQKNPKASP
jgi:hypothetical protein